MDRLAEWRHQNKSAEPRDLRGTASERHREERELLRRLLALPHDSQSDVMHALTSICVAPPEIRAEAMALMDRDKPLSYLVSFISLRRDGDIRGLSDEQPTSPAA